MAFNQILEKYRKLAFSERDKGSRFERLIQAYLYTDPKYSHLQKIWLWNEFPSRDDFGGKDVGIDLVAKTAEGEYWAIQCKCYQEDARISKDEVDSFLSTSGRSFKDAEQKEHRFTNRLWVSTTNKWSSNANEALRNQSPPVTRINLLDLQEAPVEWDKIDDGIYGDNARKTKKKLKFHQREALEKTIDYFNEGNSRGKLIMACGTGKTFTSLRIAEELTNHQGTILFLVPSIALLGQTLREWTGDARENINTIAICSDSEITKEKKKNEDAQTYSVVDLSVPASTNVKDIIKQFELFDLTNKKGMTVVFSTYQSIEVVSQAQKRLESIGSKYDKFDLVICDEAHRTTGYTLAGQDDSAFNRIHENSYINASRRVYMTATPRIFAEDTKKRADESSTVVFSMDDESLYGKEIYRIGFGEAVERDLLSDYKVLILTLSESDVTPEVQKVLQNAEHEINVEDAPKLIGCINAMSKQILGESGTLHINDPDPMRRAVAFTSSIKVSKKITDSFNDIGETYADSVPELKKETLVNLRSKHIDGSMSATERDDLMMWLKEEPRDTNESRVLTNVRCLSEGVDVPTLDAVMFLSARNSQVDVVQSVGRVMRKSPGKQYGYIIIPIVVPSDVKPEDALNDNERYKVVWTVLNALRAHDDRFNAIVNKIDLNKNRPDQILVGRPDPDGDGDPFNDTKDEQTRLQNTQLSMQFGALQSAIYAKMVQKVGDRQYWENWAKNVADIAERQIKRIAKIVDEDDEAHMAFRQFVKGLQKNINPSITEHQAIEMLSQHIITKPVFEALFEGYSFVQNNAVSISMQKALDAIEAKAIEDIDAELLDGFYKSVRKRAEGIDNSEGKQRIIVELYDKFFKTAFPQMVEQLGIVYTPLEVVDFIIHSVNDVLKKEFGRSLSDENVNILDPFTGTGTFITRLLQSGVIDKKDLERKYKHEIFANEIVLLAYYIAAVNVENAYHDLLDKDEYESFDGIVLTDTFQLSESDDNTKLFSDALPENSERLQRQQKAPLKVIIGNPPYSVGQRSANDDAQNQKYLKLEKSISSTYAKDVDATNINSVYDSYIKAIRWATDRLEDDGGVIGFITNGIWLDNKSTAGLRRELAKDFTSIYSINLRGAIRGRSGDAAKREGGNVFDILTGVAITILVKNPTNSNKNTNIRYIEMDDYMPKNEKLEFLKTMGTSSNKNLSWQDIKPNESYDWINQRNKSFDNFISIGKKKSENSDISFFGDRYSRGLSTARDAWCYSFNVNNLINNISESINFYNFERKRIRELNIKDPKAMVRAVDYDKTKTSWNRGLLNDLMKNKEIVFDKKNVQESLYRPFTKQKVYFSKEMNDMIYQLPKLFPAGFDNKVICVATDLRKDFSVLATNRMPDLSFNASCQCFPLYYYEKVDKDTPTLFDNQENTEYVRHDGITDYILNTAKDKYIDGRIEKEDIFYYVYGLLHSPDYRREFSNDLKKMLPKLPLVENLEDFWAFSKAGRELADLHINYEEVAPYEGVKVSGTQHNNYVIQKMKFPKKDQKDKIIYNAHITVENIPEKAYEYVVNGKSAIEWILDRYQVKTDKDSGIVNDPNDWAKEVGNPRYILDLLLSIINVSIKTVDIVNNLPKIDFKE